MTWGVGTGASLRVLPAASVEPAHDPDDSSNGIVIENQKPFFIKEIAS
jgi:hypothetical protein